MNLKEAIKHTAHYFHGRGEMPSHCDVRCTINDLIADNPRLCKTGYNQDLAHKRVLSIIRLMSL